MYPNPHFQVFRNIDLGEISDDLIERLKAQLSGKPKLIPAEFLYDEKGSILFDELAASDAYYLSTKELEILGRYSGDIANAVGNCEVFELGTGSGRKTKILLKAFLDEGKAISFHPIDINQAIMELGAEELLAELPDLEIRGLVGPFEDVLPNIDAGNRRRLFLFLGSSISQEEDDTLLEKVASATNDGDFFLVAYDLQKNPEIIEAAYRNEPERMVSLNALEHLNRRFGGDIHIPSFDLHVEYNLHNNRNETGVRSDSDQEIEFSDLDFRFSLPAGEVITTGHQRKLTVDGMIDRLAMHGFVAVDNFFDPQNWYALTLFQRKNGASSEL